MWGGGGRSMTIHISEEKDSPKRKKSLRKQLNGKFINIGDADKNK
jgi:hypothetical protein